MKNLIFSLVLIISFFSLEGWQNKVRYSFENDPIDVIIPCTDKDLDTLDLCIDGIRNNCNQVRRIIVISEYPLTDKAEWFDEKNFPFNKATVAKYLCIGSPITAEAYLSAPKPRVGWYIQQLYKLYAPFVIPEISSNILHLDSDTIFLNPVKFVSPSGAGLYNPGVENHPPYFAHTNKLLPGLKRLFDGYSGISHHMLLQRCVLEDLFHHVERYHNMEFWKAYCLCVDRKDLFLSGCASDEVYFNFVFTKTDQVKVRLLRWENNPHIKDIPIYKAAEYHYVSCHSWGRA